MWIPTPLYEGLPYAYVTAGSIAALSVNNLLAWVSGGILISLGSLIWIARHQHRREADPTAGSRYSGVPVLSAH
jgi:hypothetical protein